ncbi:MAG: M1 family metallopeptidase [Bacteroidales bacterium]|nr:M1 family metallopeptidase [Bacteroidales bacterium]MBN2699649.1 M1 family metallopeptidase [Bacteroidales bacterium]
MPAEIKQAYEKGTRSYDGTPGANYWQNSVDYRIKVSLDVPNKLLEGHEEVTYHNNSPDDIHELVIRLYGDVYKKGNTRAYTLNENDINEGVALSDVIINGDTCDLTSRRMVTRTATNIRFILQDPLKPGAELTFKASWKQRVPSYSTIRTGAYDSTVFFIAYWYPQVSVYDDVFGWDNLNYSLRTEFYNNLANYDVEITVPENFAVWATGTLDNAVEVLPEQIFNKYKEAWRSEDPVRIISSEDINNGFNTLRNRWHFVASGVSDFVFAASDRFRWDAAIQPVNGRDVLVSSVYPMNDTLNNYSDHVAVQKRIMQYYSEQIPGIPYPYEAFTTFIRHGRRGGGMEYPMMANNGGPGAGVTVHEMFHTYFPMYVRTNERIWAWMDEGWAVYNTSLVVTRLFNEDDEVAHLFSDVIGSADTPGTISDLPLITSSEYLTDVNYRSAAYTTPAMLNAMIHQVLGEELFLKCYREYIMRWATKAPTPYDFFYTFENVSGRDLSWLWKPWFFEFGVPDQSIQSLEEDRLTIENKGNRPLPVILEVSYKNGERKYITRDAGIWEDGKKSVQLTVPDHENIERISLNPMFPDNDVKDNFHPSLQSYYDQIEISYELAGLYRIEEHAVSFRITEAYGLFYFSRDGYGIKNPIYPVDKFTFRTLDDSATMKINLDESGRCIGMDITGPVVFHAVKTD